MNPLTPPSARRLTPLLSLVATLAGCAATMSGDELAQRTGTALGRPAQSLVISNPVEGTGGRIDYQVTTKEGARYTCFVYSATGFQRAMSFGQTPHSDAVCHPQQGAAAAPAPCNALSRAAGKCTAR